MPAPRKIRCAITDLIDHGGHVYTVELAPESPVPVFRPGQFLHLALDPYDPSGFWPESRVFSIASRPAERNRLTVCYSVKGAFTKRMEQELRKGSEVWVKLPYGDFVVEAKADVVLFAGGTGVTAFTAFVADLNAGRSERIFFYYGARNPELLLFRKQLEAAVAEVPSFHLSYCVEQGNIKSGSNRLRTRAGILSVALAAEDGLLNPATTFYLSGPPAMLKALSASLVENGINPAQIRVDAWE
jgi:ferredoxin-NADP reductase